MKLLWKLGLVLVLMIAVGAIAYPFVRNYFKGRNAPKFRTSKVVIGEIASVVNATGTVQPTLRVQVGAVVSGPIVKLNVDHNDDVLKVDPEEDLSEEELAKRLLAEIDPRIYKAAVTRDEAATARARADVTRVKALLEQSWNDYRRALGLQEENEDFISGTEIDQYKYSYLSLKAQLAVADASLAQAEANLENSEANLGYTKIYSPVDGIVIDRKIDEGQTLASQFQAPVLFEVAPNMDKEMYVHASVDESEIGQIHRAQEEDQPVFFAIDAYPDDLFEGEIYQIRKNPTSTQNVVTYPVLITTPNPEIKLLPGMTANISFQVEHREEIIKVPNAALRFYPEDKKQVRKEDHAVMEGEEKEDEEEEEEEDSSDLRSAMQRILARRERKKRHVWVLEDKLLKAVEITVGLSDYKYTEMVSGDLEKGQELVVGKSKKE
ncbi:MAG: efflux RND transporter periplasmic adaptor subunit [Planctomycetes bacterium]|nr:efflux RND transporter periplasmic adaptor subunit [Planctomycetota bacterium]